jgi:hypothetical protein
MTGNGITGLRAFLRNYARRGSAAKGTDTRLRASSLKGSLK